MYIKEGGMSVLKKGRMDKSVEGINLPKAEISLLKLEMNASRPVMKHHNNVRNTYIRQVAPFGMRQSSNWSKIQEAPNKVVGLVIRGVLYDELQSRKTSAIL